MLQVFLAGEALAQSNHSQAESPIYDPTNATIFQMSADPGQAFFMLNTVSLAKGGGSDVGEVFRIATQIQPGNEDSVYSAFMPFADKIHTLAESIDPRIDPVGARENYFHASTYYRSASYYLVANPDDPRLNTTWDKAIADFNKAVALLQPPGEPFTVRAKNSSIGLYDVPAYFFKADASCDKPLPTIVIITGYDASQQDEYHAQCIEGLRRGFNCVTLEGPGQPSPRRYQGLPFIPDYWTALIPVIDNIVTRKDVDISKIILLGESFGGTLGAIAASHEPRLAGLICLDGLASLQKVIASRIDPLLDLFESGNKTAFDQAVYEGLINNASQPLSSRYYFQQSLYTFKTKSPFDWFTQLGKISMTIETVQGVGQRPVYVAKGQVSISAAVMGYRSNYDRMIL